MKTSTIFSFLSIAATAVFATAHEYENPPPTYPPPTYPPPTNPPPTYPPPTQPGVCQECIPSPNNCDITAPCASFVDKLYCACRPGYKAAQYADDDTAHQWRIDTLPGHEHRVWVAPGVVCNDLCDNPWGTTPCYEVAVDDTCAPTVY